MKKNAKSARLARALPAAIALLGGISAAHGAPALVQIGVGGCSMLDGNGNQLNVSDPKLKVKVSTQSANNNLILTCEIADVPNSTGRAVRYGPEDGQCLISDPRISPPNDPRRVADVWHQVVSASGQAVLTCMTHTP